MDAFNVEPGTQTEAGHRRDLERFRALPFVDFESGRDHHNWALPAESGYTVGCFAGEAAAKLYLKHLRACEAANGWNLQSIVMDAAARATGSDAFDRVRDQEDRQAATLMGHLVGFLGFLDRALSHAAKRMPGLDLLLEGELREQLDKAALARDEQILGELKRDRLSAAARKGWRTRRRLKATSARQRA